MKPIAFVVAAAVLTCGAGAAQAQTCTIAPPPGVPADSSEWGARFQEGSVVSFGDLRIRATAFGPTYVAPVTNEWTSDWANVDLKAPGLELRGLVLQRRVPKTLMVCGREVTITFVGNAPTNAILVSLF